jgi:hydrogenase/urease accessory protein HupE
VDCGGRSLAGARIGVDGLAARGTDALVRLHLADGRLVQGVVRGGEPFLTVPERPGPAEVFGAYVGLGFEHILGGLDHLAFVLGLVLLVRGRRALLWTVTAFTAGHSVTLSLAALGVVRVPAAGVEVLIAVSIVAVAVELARPDRGPIPRWRSPWAMAGAFGLLHGLGFAGALTEVGLPAGEIPAALFAFNCGIEAGQLLFVAGLLLAGSALARTGRKLPPFVALPTAGVPAYAIGALAAYWVIERIWGLSF